MAIVKRNNFLQQKATASLDGDDVLVVELAQNLTTGYRWQLLQHEGFELTQGYKQQAEAPGGGGAAVFSLTPNTGFRPCMLQFEYRKPWEQQSKAEAIFEVEVKTKTGDELA